MSVAVCDPKAFYPLRSLVAGPLKDLRELTEIERFVRTAVLHDEISMELEPWPYDPEADIWTEGERQRGKRNVLVALGPVLTGYDFFKERVSGRKPETPNITLSPTVIEVANEFSNADETNWDFEIE